MPMIMSATPRKKRPSTILWPLSNRCAMKVVMNVMQLTAGTAIERSLAAITKLLRTEAS